MTYVPLCAQKPRLSIHQEDYKNNLSDLNRTALGSPIVGNGRVQFTRDSTGVESLEDAVTQLQCRSTPGVRALCSIEGIFLPCPAKVCLSVNIQSSESIATGIVLTMTICTFAGLNQFDLRCLNANGRDWA